MTTGANATNASKTAWENSKKNSKTNKPLPDAKRVENIVKLEAKYPFLNIADELNANFQAIQEVITHMIIM